MSILNAIKETRHESDNLTKLAKLPQALIMGMAQRGEIEQDMLMPILGKKAEMAEQAAKMKAAEALAAQGGAQPTVMDNLMSRIAAAENPAPEAPPMPQQQMQQPMPQQMAQGPEDVGIAGQMTAPMQMAGGGIIAFDDGGDVESYEDEDDERNEDAREQEVNEYIFDMLSKQQGGARSSDGERSERRSEGGDDLEARLRAAIMQRESGGRRYGKDGNLLTSSKGALGEMQVMPATARDPGFGIKPAKNVSDPDELSRVGSQYVGALLNKYQDPTLTMIAYNYGPGATDKWLAAGADIKKLPKETQNYIRGVNLAKGGEVPGYYDGGTMGGFGTFSDEDNAMDMLRVENLAEERKRKEYEDKYNFLKNSAPELAAKMKPPVARKSAAEPVKTAATPATAPAEDSPKSSIPQSSKGIQSIENEQKQESNSLMDYVKRREARMEKADKEDKNMALLAAGLNMMGGTSPYAMVNIGQGGAAGVQQLAASKRTRAAQEASLGKLYGSAAQTDALNKIRRDQLTQTGDVARERMDQKLLTDKNSFIKDRLARSGLNEQMIQALKGKQLDKTLSKKDAQRLALYESEMQKIYTEADRMFSNPRDTTGFSARKIG